MKFYINSEGAVSSPGIDLGVTTLVDLKDDVVVTHTEGHKYWSSRGPGPTHSYAPADYRVWRIEKIEVRSSDQVMVQARQISRFPASSNKTSRKANAVDTFRRFVETRAQ